MKKLLLFSAALLSLNVSVWSKVTLPPIFDNNMVLQRETDAAVWGKATPGATVTISPSWTVESTAAKAGEDGKWFARVATPEAGGPYEITFSDAPALKNRKEAALAHADDITLKNVLVGEVWLCSGQSNMEMPLKGFYCQRVANSSEVLAAATPDRPIRLFYVKKQVSAVEIDSCRTIFNDCNWADHTPDHMASCSATAYYFADLLQKNLGVPVGIINAFWGGSPIEVWMNKATLDKFSGTELYFKSDDKTTMHRPSYLFNAMINPLIPYTIKGWIWYQGEQNIPEAGIYADLQLAYIQMMRNLWDAPQMPFYFVQIAPYRYDGAEKTGAPLLMEQQAKTLVADNSGMATTVDLGDRDCIHPCNKKPVGQRLAFLALGKTYGVKYFEEAAAPEYESMKIDGNKVTLSFKCGFLGLSPLGHFIGGFEIAGEDEVFHKATTARINYVKPYNTVTISSDEVAAPVAVRYRFHNYTETEGDFLYNSFGMPAGPFRTDNWDK